MKAVVYHGGTEVRLEEMPVPSPAEGEALIKVSYAGVCGSDVTIYTGKHRRVKPPVIFGHELSGEIVELGSPAEGLFVGDRVVVEPLVPCGECHACRLGAYNACRNLRHLGIDLPGMFAEYVKAQTGRVYRVPDTVSQRAAALVEPTAVAAHVVARSGAGAGDHVVVLGGGPIGLLVAQVARATTGAPVEVVEVGDWRLDFARKLGFDPIDAGAGDMTRAVLERTGGIGADVLVDAAGVAATAGQLAAMTRIRGQVALVAMPKEPLAVDLNAFVLKEIDFAGCRAYTRTDFERAIALIAENEIDAESMVTHVLPLERWQEGLEMAKKAGESMKILLAP